MQPSNHLTISVLIPTLNSASVLGECLRSIIKQDYPKEKIEIIIADGGSTDDTLNIVGEFKVQSSKFKVRVVSNPLKTGEAGKAVALRYAQGKLVALIDSDNVLPDKNWLKRMVEPFKDPEIIGSEPWKFTYRKRDSLVNRYCALLGVNDPYCYFVGNYDRKSILSGKWTGLKVNQEDQGQYLKVGLKKGILPTLGANGTVWRTVVLREVVGKSNYLFDTDVPYLLTQKSSFWFAKVKVGIIHDYCQDIGSFCRKQKRRIRDFLYLESEKQRKATYQRRLGRQIYFIFFVLLFFPLVFQALKGYIKKPERAWFFHPLACLITLWVYGTETILAQFKKSQMSRGKWSQ